MITSLAHAMREVLFPRKSLINAPSFSMRYGAGGILQHPQAQSDVVYHYSMDSAADIADPEGVGGSAEDLAGRATTTTHRSDGTWDSGNSHYLRISQFLTPTGQQDAGININLQGIGLADTTSYSIGWVSRHGTDWYDSLIGTPKMVFVEVTADGTTRNHAHTPMLSEMPSEPLGSVVGAQTADNPSSNNWTTEAGLYTTPNDNGSDITYDYLANTLDWVYYELTHVHGTSFNLSIFDRNGIIGSQNLIINTSAADVLDSLLQFRFVTFVDFDGTGSVNSYIDISDLYVDNSYMGPPAGFLL